MSNFIVNTDVPNLRVLIRNGDEYNVNITHSDISTAYTGSFNTYADLAGAVVTASYALVAQTLIGSIESASYSVYAVTASYVDGATSDWDTLANKPEGLVSSSTQATPWTVATSSIATSASFSTTSSYAHNADLLDGRDSLTYASTGSNIFVGSQTVTGSVAVTEGVSVDYIDIDTTAVVAGQPGRLVWNDGDGTLDLGLKGGNTTIQLGQEVVARVFNQEATTLTEGTIVYISGAQGNRIAVRRASAVDELGSANTLGMVTETILSGQEGFITLFGVVRGLNTAGLTEGALLWLSSTPGTYTETRPEAPLHGVLVGYVERAHPSAGSIYVKVDNGFELDELHDVNVTDTPSHGELLVRSGSIWVNGRQLTGTYGITGSLTVQGTISGSVALPNGIVSSSTQATTWTVASASVAISASYAPSILPSGVVSSSAQATTWTVASSSVATSASYAPTILPLGVVSSSAQASAWTVASASFALTASYVSGAASTWETIANKPDGLVSSSAQATTWTVASSSVAISASYAPTVLPTGVVSSSAQINTGSFTGSFVGTLTGTSSLAISAVSASYISGSINFPDGLSVTGSVTATGGFIGTASYALTASYVSGAASSWDTISGKPEGLVSSSVQATTWTVATASLALTASYFDGNVNFPEGLTITGSTLSTGGFTGSLLGTSSVATSASFAPTILPSGVVSSSAQATTWTVASSSIAQTASLALNNIVTASVAATTITFTKGDGSTFPITIAQSGSVESASYAVTAGTATSASYAPTVLPSGVVSSSAQATTWTVATASVATSASYAPTILPAGTVSSSAQIDYTLIQNQPTTIATASYVESASYAPTILPSGVVSSSAQAADWTVATASIATTASFALTASYVSGAASSWDTIADKPSGLVSSSVQINTGSFTGSFVGEFIGTASYAETASIANGLIGYATFPQGLTITGSTLSTGGFTGSLQGTASVANALSVNTTINTSASLSPEFTRITSGTQHLSDGTYAVSAILNDGTFVNHRISGMMSWYTDVASDDSVDELFLHRIGQSNSSASFFMRTTATSGSTIWLEVGSDLTIPSSSYAFNFTKLT